MVPGRSSSWVAIASDVRSLRSKPVCWKSYLGGYLCHLQSQMAGARVERLTESDAKMIKIIKKMSLQVRGGRWGEGNMLLSTIT